MTNKEWEEELAAAVEGSGWSIFSSGCTPGTSTCFAYLNHHATKLSKQVKLSRDTFITSEARKAEIVRQLKTY